jgi:hypothetical protein
MVHYALSPLAIKASSTCVISVHICHTALRLIAQQFAVTGVRTSDLPYVMSPCLLLYKPWLISNLMHKILIYLYIIHLLNSSTCFEHYLAHLQEVYVVIVYMQPLVSSLSAGDYLVHRLRKNCSSFLTGAQDSHLQRMTTPEAAYI